jgi:hypothetical protein
LDGGRRVREDIGGDASGRREHVGASADLRAVATEIAEQVRLLDELVRYRFGDNAELMGAWASARNVEGPFRSKAEPEVAGGEGPGVVKPAAGAPGRLPSENRAPSVK